MDRVHDVRDLGEHAVPYQMYAWFAVAYCVIAIAWTTHWFPYRKANAQLQGLYSLIPLCKTGAAIILWSFNYHSVGHPRSSAYWMPIAAELLQNFSIYFCLTITLRGLSTTIPRLPSRVMINVLLISFTVAVTSTVYYVRQYIGGVLIIDLVCFNIYVILIVLMFRGAPRLIRQLSDRQKALTIQGIRDPMIDSKLWMLRFCLGMAIGYAILQMVTGLLEDFVFGDWPQWIRDIVDEAQDFMLLTLFLVFRVREFNKTGRYAPVGADSRASVAYPLGSLPEYLPESGGLPGAGQPTIPSSVSGDFATIEMYPPPSIPGAEPGQTILSAPPPISPQGLFGSHLQYQSKTSVPQIAPPPNDMPRRTIPKTDDQTNEWECMKCTYLNHLSQDFCSSCESWACAFCTFDNPTSSQVCGMCSKSRKLRPAGVAREEKQPENAKISQPPVQTNVYQAAISGQSQPLQAIPQIAHQGVPQIPQRAVSPIPQQVAPHMPQPAPQLQQPTPQLQQSTPQLQQSTPQAPVVVHSTPQAAPGDPTFHRGGSLVPGAPPAVGHYSVGGEDSRGEVTPLGLPQVQITIPSKQVSSPVETDSLLEIKEPNTEPQNFPEVQYDRPPTTSVLPTNSVTQPLLHQVIPESEPLIPGSGSTETPDAGGGIHDPPHMLEEIKEHEKEKPAQVFDNVPSTPTNEESENIPQTTSGVNLLKILMECNKEGRISDEGLSKLLKLIRENPEEKKSLIECHQASEDLEDFVGMLHDSEYL